MNRLINNIVLALLHPGLLWIRLLHRLPMRQLVELQQMEDQGIFRGITHYIDAGAHAGVFAESVVRLLPGVRAICFEPAPVAYAALARRFTGNPNVCCVACALGEKPGRAVLNVSGLDQASSLLPMSEAHTAAWRDSGYVDRVEVEVVPLEPYLLALEPEDRVLLKADVQGFEQQVIKGCGAGLDRVQVVQLELSLVELYAGAPLLPEMVSFMSELGFDLYDVVGRVAAPDTGRTMQIDGLFVRRTDSNR